MAVLNFPPIYRSGDFPLIDLAIAATFVQFDKSGFRVSSSSRKANVQRITGIRDYSRLSSQITRKVTGKFPKSLCGVVRMSYVDATV